ncbi:MAG: CcmD family protein [Cyclobacteriaceae bacterium]|jgi:hypothetical protein
MKNLLGLLLSLISMSAVAQSDVEMADVMRSDGKIYVVVGIILIILVGLLLYLFKLDRKITRLESQTGSNKS